MSAQEEKAERVSVLLDLLDEEIQEWTELVEEDLDCVSPDMGEIGIALATLRARVAMVT